MSKMKVRNNTLMKIICYGQATNQGMVWFRIVRIGSIFGCIASFTQIWMALFPDEMTSSIFDPIYQLYVVLSSLPGFILGIIATYGLFNLKYWTYKWLVAALLPINAVLSLVFLPLLPQEIISYSITGIIVDLFSRSIVSAIAITYFSKRKDIFNPNDVVTIEKETE